MLRGQNTHPQAAAKDSRRNSSSSSGTSSSSSGTSSRATAAFATVLWKLLRQGLPDFPPSSAPAALGSLLFSSRGAFSFFFLFCNVGRPRCCSTKKTTAAGTNAREGGGGGGGREEKQKKSLRQRQKKFKNPDPSRIHPPTPRHLRPRFQKKTARCLRRRFRLWERAAERGRVLPTYPNQNR